MSALSWLKPTTLAATVVVAGTLLVAAPVQAQDVTVLRGSPAPQPAATVDCNDPYYANNPDYAQYCQAYEAWLNQYYGDAYPYYGYGVPVGIGLGFGFFHHGGNFHDGFHGGGFHGGGFHGGGFHGGGGHGGGGHR